jgi:phosphatidylethanolamine-binding protein (PEBP) family uncharacterized protein
MRARTVLLVVLFTLVLAPTACQAVGAPASTASASSGGSNATAAPASASQFTISSPAVVDGKLLPQYKCERKRNGVEESIPLAWANVPAGTRSLAVIMYHCPDPNDLSNVNSYLLLWGIDPSVTEIPYGKADDGPWFMGSNKDGTAISYTSPCSKGAGTHEYTITIYALSQTPPALPQKSTVEVTYHVLKEAIDSVTLVGSASLTFTNVTP